MKNLGATIAVSMMILAGIGISYAGFTDEITIHGDVQTGSVDINLLQWDGVLLWKIWNWDGFQFPGTFTQWTIDPDNEIAVFRFPWNDGTIQREQSQLEMHGNVELVSTVEVTPGTTHDYDITYTNVFPSFDYTAALIFKNEGSIPSKIQWPTINHESGVDFTSYITIKAYTYTQGLFDAWFKDVEIPMQDFPYQVHQGDVFGFELTLNLPQNNDYQNVNSEFSFDISAIQWYDP